MSSSIKGYGGYCGRSFFFFGRAAKPMEELPEFDPRVLEFQPGSREVSKEPPQDPQIKKIVEEVVDEMRR